MSCNSFREQEFELKKLDKINEKLSLKNERLQKFNDKDRIVNEKLTIENDKFRVVTERANLKLEASRLQHQLTVTRIDGLNKLYSKYLDKLSPCLEPAKKSTEDIGYIFERLKVEEQIPSEHCDDITRILRGLTWLLIEAKNEKKAIPPLSNQENPIRSIQ